MNVRLTGGRSTCVRPNLKSANQEVIVETVLDDGRGRRASRSLRSDSARTIEVSADRLGIVESSSWVGAQNH
jgi:hypothetical protein